ncbi:MAG: ATP-binding protein [bacterium]
MSKKIKPEDIYKKDISFDIKIGNKSCKVNILDSLFARIDNDEDILLDDIVIKKMISDFKTALRRNQTKYNPLPESITISHTNTKLESNKDKDKNTAYIESYQPRWSFDDIYLDDKTKKQIIYSLSLISNNNKLFKEWGLENTLRSERAVILNFFGPPGTGKTITAEAVADYLEREVFLVNYAELESKYVGETPKNIKRVFKRAKNNNSILVFDEADSFLGKRLTNISQSADYGVNITRSVLLKEIENVEGIIIFTTNLISNYDQAFKRRILANIKFKKPDQHGRRKIWEKLLPEKLPLAEEVTPEILADTYDNITGADIRDMILYASVICVEDKRQCLILDDFKNSYQYIQNRYLNKDNDLQVIKHEKISQKQYQEERENYN